MLSLIVFFSPISSAQDQAPSNKKLISAIKEAWDYNTVKPKRALEILEENKALLTQAPELHKFLYFKTGFWASVYLYDLKQTSYFADAMFHTKDFPKRKLALSGLLNSLSIWYRRNQQYPLSIEASYCAVAMAKSELSLTRITMTAGISYMLLDDMNNARSIFLAGLNLSERLGTTSAVTALKNNLGILSVLQSEYSEAEEYFRSALKVNQEIDRANSTTLNLVNLLLVFYLQQDWDNFNRLHNRANRATKLLESEDLKHYFFWLSTAYAVKTEKRLESYQQEALRKSYQQINEPSILKLLRLIATDLNISLPTTSNTKPVKALDFATLFPMCLEYKNDNTPFEQLLTKKIDSLKQKV